MSAFGLRLEGQTVEGKEMRETEEKHGWMENKPVGREELGEAHEEHPGRADDLDMLNYLRCDIDLVIPGYVMWDFETDREESKSSKKTP
jgi:hypothetical protein